MKRIATVLLLFFSFIAFSARAQVVKTLRPTPLTKGSTVASFGTESAAHLTIPAPSGDFQPLSIRTDTVGYFGDTTGGNWWIYCPILDQASGDSLDYFGVNGGGWFYTQNADTIGPLEFKYTNAAGVVIDTTPTDTMYDRVLGVRVTPPTDITKGTIKIVGASLTFLPVSFNPTDSIQFWVVPIADAQFGDGTSHPIPSLFGVRSATGQVVDASPIATGSIPADSIVVGQINTVYVKFSHGTQSPVLLSTADDKNQVAVVWFVNGQNFTTDTVGFMLDQNLNQDLGSSLTIDTDGSAGITGEPMRSYKEDLDGGHIVIEGSPNYIGGGGGFLVNFSQLDPTSGAATGQAFDGNFVLNTYFTGTASGVNSSSVPGYSLEESYPNPVSSQSSINYNLGQSGPVTIALYNQLGEQVQTIVNAVQGPGLHTANFNAGTLPDGMYYYKLQSGEFSAMHTLVIAH